MKNAFVNVKGLAAATLAMGLALGAQAAMQVEIKVPEVEGAEAKVYEFRQQGGWDKADFNKVSSNAQVRVVWTAVDPDKSLTAPGVANVLCWTDTFVATGAVNMATAPEVTSGESEITFSLDTREKKLYYSADDILPIWYASEQSVTVIGDDTAKTTLVSSPTSTNTFGWKPSAQDNYHFAQGTVTATIVYQMPVEVVTNGIESVDTTYEVMYAEVKDPKAEDFKPLPEDGLIGSNNTVKVIYTIADEVEDKYFADGTRVYETTFIADRSVNPASEMVTKPADPKEPSIKLGTVAQRYPWNGMLDVQYNALNTPNEGYFVIVTVKLPGEEEKPYEQSEQAKNGINTATFDAKAAFGEVNIPKGVKVSVKLIKGFN